MKPRSARAPKVFTALVVAALASGCGDQKAAPRAAASGSPRGAAPRSAAAAPAVGAVTGQVQLSAKKRSVNFSIELPQGLLDVSEAPYMKAYAARPGSFDGYTFQLSEANPQLAAMSLEVALATVSKEPDFIKNKARLLDKGAMTGGWYFAHAIQEGKKKAVLVTAITKEGDVALQCRGNVEGPLADAPDAPSAVLVKACKTLKIMP